MSSFEKWWNESDHSKVIGEGNSYAAAKEAWDAAFTLADAAMLKGTFWDLDRMVT